MSECHNITNHCQRTLPPCAGLVHCAIIGDCNRCQSLFHSTSTQDTCVHGTCIQTLYEANQSTVGLLESCCGVEGNRIQMLSCCFVGWWPDISVPSGLRHAPVVGHALRMHARGVHGHD